MVVACVTVHGHAEIITSPIEDLGIPGAVVRDGGGIRGFMAAGSPDCVLWWDL